MLRKSFTMDRRHDDIINELKESKFDIVELDNIRKELLIMAKRAKQHKLSEIPRGNFKILMTQLHIIENHFYDIIRILNKKQQKHWWV